MAPPMPELLPEVSPRRRVIVFLLCVVALTLTVEGGLAWLRPASTPCYGLTVSWSPAMAAWLASRWCRRPAAECGWTWPAFPWLARSYLIPLLYSAGAYGLAVAAGWATLGGEGLQHLEAGFSLDKLPPGLAVSILVLLSATYGCLQACLSALGEEIGWRGFLTPELAKFLPFTRVSLVTGAIWALWHYPIILFADYNNGTPPWWSLPCFTAVLMAISFPMTWLRLESGSLWTGMIFHASHNLFILQLLNPMTEDKGWTRFVVSEFGLATVVTTTAAALWSVRQARIAKPSSS